MSLLTALFVGVWVLLGFFGALCLTCDELDDNYSRRRPLFPNPPESRPKTGEFKDI